jgi:hypothetical protein
VLSTQDYQAAADMLRCPLASVQAVAEVEAPRGGFDPDGDPRTLFEGHHFHKWTQGCYDLTHPTLSYPEWTTKFYGKTWQAEKERLRRAQSLNWVAASLSASWGKFQILGSNFAACGFTDIRSFVAAMKVSESTQLQAFVKFIQNEGLDDELRTQSWTEFARRYNGRRYAEHGYHLRLAAAFKKWSGG